MQSVGGFAHARRWAGVALGVVATAVAISADYPDRAVTLIVAYGAGGGTDVTARLLARDLEHTIRRPVIVQNVTGGGGWNGWSAIANSRPDGYTIGYINVPNMFAGYLDPKIGRPERLESFTLLMGHVTDHCVWAVRARSAFSSVKDVVAAAKHRAGGVSITAHGYGNEDHLAILSMQDTTGVRFKVVHNKGTAESKSQVLGGHVDVLAANVSEVAAQHQAGQLRVLGVMSARRSEFLPDVRTFREQGFDQEWSVSRGIAAPRGLPQDRADALVRALETTITSAAHRATAAKLGLTLELTKGRRYVDLLKAQEQSIKKLMRW